MIKVSITGNKKRKYFFCIQFKKYKIILFDFVMAMGRVNGFPDWLDYLLQVFTLQQLILVMIIDENVQKKARSLLTLLSLMPYTCSYFSFCYVFFNFLHKRI